MANLLLKISGTAAGTDTYTLSDATADEYVTGGLYLIAFTNANTGASTLNINGIGAKAIVKNGVTALAATNIVAGSYHLMVYDGTNFQIVNIA